MRLPARPYVLPNGLRWEVEAIPYQSFHYHVLKHPLGVHRERNAAGYLQPWDRELWTELQPAALTIDERPRILEQLAAIRAGDAQCGVAEVHGSAPPKRSPADFPCRACPRPVAVQCERVLVEQHVVARRYAEVTEALVQSLVDGVLVSRAAWLESVAFAARVNGVPTLDAAVTMSVGLLAQGPRTLARISQGDGVRAELWVRGTLHWRTTYRVPHGPIPSFLCQLLPQSGAAASESCLVNRLWWESHGH
jgi:hypothetical protein